MNIWQWTEKYENERLKFGELLIVFGPSFIFLDPPQFLEFPSTGLDPEGKGKIPKKGTHISEGRFENPQLLHEQEEVESTTNTWAGRGWRRRGSGTGRTASTPTPGISPGRTGIRLLEIKFLKNVIIFFQS